MKKIICLVLMLLLVLSGCGTQKEERGSEKLSVVATLFPQYDFARELGCEYAEVSLLLPPGSESHSYEPTPKDIIKINEADVFLYTGEYMEAWAHDITESIDSDVIIVDVSEGITLDMLTGHAHEGEGHVHYDPHIWTNPEFALVMCENIKNAFIKADAENSTAYTEAFEAYKAKLEKFDADMLEMLAQANQNTVCFGDRFAMHYFAKHYKLDYISAYDSCSEETEPSAKAIADIIDTMTEKGIKTVFYAEMSEPTVARTISEETGAQMLMLHSCHNVSKSELEQGVTYLSLMYQNLENLREGLK